MRDKNKTATFERKREVRINVHVTCHIKINKFQMLTLKFRREREIFLPEKSTAIHISE